jgi:predicted aldo/keto reductase-like oxidoreductase
LAYLQLDSVDLFGLHGINNAEIWDHSIPIGGCLEVLK